MPVPVHRSAKALGFETESPLTARFPDLCRAIKAKRATVQQARRSRTASALKAALTEDPAERCPDGEPAAVVASGTCAVRYHQGHVVRQFPQDSPRYCYATSEHSRHGGSTQKSHTRSRRFSRVCQPKLAVTLWARHHRVPLTAGAEVHTM